MSDREQDRIQRPGDWTIVPAVFIGSAGLWALLALAGVAWLVGETSIAVRAGLIGGAMVAAALGLQTTSILYRTVKSHA